MLVPSQIAISGLTETTGTAWTVTGTVVEGEGHPLELVVKLIFFIPALDQLIVYGP